MEYIFHCVCHLCPEFDKIYEQAVAPSALLFLCNRCFVDKHSEGTYLSPKLAIFIPSFEPE